MEINKKQIKLGIMLLFLGGIIYFLFLTKEILLPFIFGTILVYLFYPLICYLHDKNVSSSGIIYFIFIIFFLIIGVMGFIIFPLFLKELEGLTTMIPKYINFVEEYITHLNQEYERVGMPAIIKEVIDRTLSRFEEGVITFIQNLTECIINSLSMVFSILIAPVISYYLIKDMDKIKESFLNFIPGQRRSTCLRIGQEINKVFVGYLRGQIWVSLIVGILSSIGLYFLKIRFFIILGIIAGITNMIPYIGPIIGGIPAVFIALLSSPLQALGVVFLFVFVQQFEGMIIGPKIMSEKVGLHPLTIIFALLAGAELAGIWGLLFAVPIAGSIKVIVYFIRGQLFPVEN